MSTSEGYLEVMDDTSLLNVTMAVIGIAAFMWAYLNKQFSRTEAAAAEPLKDSEAIRASVSLPLARRAAVVVLVVLVFASLLWSIAFTVIMSINATKTHAVSSGPTSDGIND
jgi:nitrogen fixation-related uncharacterized protein